MTTQTESPFPLTPLQQGMLFHHLRAPSAGVDVEQIVVHFPADRDFGPDLGRAVAAAFAQVAARHPVLRARVDSEQHDEPVLVPAAECRPRVVEQALPPGDATFAAWLTEDRQRALDLTVVPSFRLTLLRTPGRPPILVWTFHHLFVDGRSFADVLHEVLTVLANGSLPAPPSVVFGAHSRALATRDRAADEAFWRAELAAVTPQLELPLPRPAAAVVGYSRGHARGRLSAEVTQQLAAVAERAGASVNNVVQAAWALAWARYTGETDVVFGAVRACRRGTVPAAERIVGAFLNTLPLRVRVDEGRSLLQWLPELRSAQRRIAAHELASLADVQQWAGRGSEPLFGSVLVYDHRSLDRELRARGGAAAGFRFELHERTVYPLTLTAYGEGELELILAFDRDRYGEDAMQALLRHLETLLQGFAAHAERPLAELPMLPAAESTALLGDLEATRTPFDEHATILDRIRAQVARTPDRVAVRAGEHALRYDELDRRSDELAARLRALGVERDQRVGVCTSRSPAMLVAVLAVWKAGGAYVPLDPGYPRERLHHKLADATVRALVGETEALRTLDGLDPLPPVIVLEPANGRVVTAPSADAALPGLAVVAPRDAAYVMYTSGSTGRPKGVVVEHRNLLNFCAAMDRVVPVPERGVWLAVTSLAFDISVLELFWTLTRGFEVVLQPSLRAAAARKAPTFSLFYFASSHGGDAQSRYDLLLRGARFADQQGFEAVWTPERHFHDFGGLYPNPAVTSAALATITARVQLRGGSVVLPLHDPLRVAEEWALVDNLSSGRVGMAFASGWQRDDFVLQPHRYHERKDVMLRDLETVRALWRGETIERDGVDGARVRIATQPRPVQPELPVWLTTAGNVATWELAGRVGANVLTHLLGQSLDEIATKIDAYRRARRTAGHDGPGRVTLMLHTFVGGSDEEVHRTVRQPMLDYLRSSLGLAREYIASFPTFKTQASGEGEALNADFRALSDADTAALLEHSFERYYTQSGLFGTVETCARLVQRVHSIGVDEIACLVDFGVPTVQVVAMFERLAELHEAVRSNGGEADRSLPELLVEHGATHLQSTPSLLNLVLQQDGGREALARLECLLVGGEAVPPALARELCSLVPHVTNVYGPTETTVWSTSQRLRADDSSVAIGKPLANTEVLVLDARRRPVPFDVPGELHIGGAGVARCYLNRPDLDAERFVAHPFAPDRRLYRTGDLVRRRRDGVLEFLGRNDTQVKVRGHRIELGEIEGVLREHELVHEAAVVVRSHPGGGEQLVAFCAARGAAPDADRLRRHLRERLPEWMLPSRFVVLPTLPKTPNGKIDRNALPAAEPAPQPTAAAAATAAPAGVAHAVTDAPAVVLPTPASAHSVAELERQIGAIWGEVLGVAQVDANQNFFDLGGHSLLTVQVQGRLKRQLGRAIALTDLFRYPTLRALAQFLAGGSEGPAAAGAGVAERAQARVESGDRLLSLRERRQRGRGTPAGDA